MDDEPPTPFEEGKGVTDELLKLLDHPSLMGGLQRWEVSFEGRGWVEEAEKCLVARRQSSAKGEGEEGAPKEQGEGAGHWDELVRGGEARGVTVERVRKFGWDLASGCESGRGRGEALG